MTTGELSSTNHNLIVLGASNVARCISAIVNAGRIRFGGPTNFFMAYAHGRSFGLRSQVLIRSIPGILDCQLWKSLPQPGSNTSAVITDVGNDLLYNVPVQKLLTWVRTCVERLTSLTDQIVLTELPMDSISTLGNRRYLLMRTILFPPCRLNLAEIIARAQAVNQGLIELAATFRLKICKPNPYWYGFDPIHVKQNYKAEAWHEILTHVTPNHLEARPLLFDWFLPVYLRTRAPESRRILGFEQRRSQPAGKLRDGSQIFLF